MDFLPPETAGNHNFMMRLPFRAFFIFKKLCLILKTPLWRIFFRPAALIFLGIHKVLLRKIALHGEKTSRHMGISRY
jgi:hypothetical protein